LLNLQSKSLYWIPTKLNITIVSCCDCAIECKRKFPIKHGNARSTVLSIGNGEKICVCRQRWSALFTVWWRHNQTMKINRSSDETLMSARHAIRWWVKHKWITHVSPTWSWVVPIFFASSCRSTRLSCVYRHRRSPSSMFFIGLLSDGCSQRKCLWRQNEQQLKQDRPLQVCTATSCGSFKATSGAAGTSVT